MSMPSFILRGLRCGVVLAALILMTNARAQAASVASPGGMSLTPPYQEITLQPQEAATQGAVLLHNQSEQPIELEAFVVDFQQVGQFGELQLLPSGRAENSRIAEYVTLEQDRFILPPNQKKELIFTVENRSTLGPGGHYAAIIFRQKDDTTLPGKQKFTTAMSSLLLIRKIGGERTLVSLNRTRLGVWPLLTWNRPESFSFLLRNDGNIHVTPRGEVKVHDIFGRQVARGIVNEDSLILLPGAQRYITVRLHPDKWLPPATILWLTLAGTIETDRAVTFSLELSGVYIHWGVIVTLSLLPLIFLLFRLWKRRATHRTLGMRLAELLRKP